MSTSIKSGVMVLIDPNEVKLGRNSRWDGEPMDQEKIEERYKSFVQVGQLQPCRVRKDGNDIVLEWGFYRHAAAMLYNERHPDRPMKLKVVASAMNSEDALVESIAENRERHATSPMDDAFAQKRLREEHGWDDKRVADLYRCSPGQVSRLKNLLYLSRELQGQVHRKELSVDAAIKLSGLSEAERSAVVEETRAEVAAEAAEANGQVEPGTALAVVPTQVLSKRIIGKVREKQIEKGGAVSRTLADVRKFFTGLEEKAEGEVKDFCKLLLKFFSGGVGEATVAKRIKEWIK